MQQLPIGTQSFKVLREENYVYVDKTPHIFDLITSGRYYFLSRPRRFGKSLLVDTMHCLFEGKRELFDGLRIEDKRDWSQKFPVVKISFGLGAVSSRETLVVLLNDLLHAIARKNDIVYQSHGLGGKLSELIIALYQKHNQQVVVLIDEYDKSILDNITKTGVVDEIRDELKGFYGVLKDLDQYLKFTFLTGITKFSKVSLFSGLNNLKDITIDPRFGEICGMTLDEIQTQFPSEYLDEADYEKMQYRYNGFNFLGEYKVFNPFDVLLYLDSKEFKNYRFETATPSFLIKVLQDNKQFYYLPNLFDLSAGEELLGSFDINNINIETLLFQSGYLTIDEVTYLGQDKEYHLVVPNYEVKKSLSNYLVQDYLGFDRIAKKGKATIETLKALRDGRPKNVVEQIKIMFANITYTNHIKNYLAMYEGYYSSVVYAFLYGGGVEVIAEDMTNEGRIDMVLKYDERVYVLEFKVEKDGKTAMQQIKDKNYAQKYGNYEVYLIGINFDMKKRQIESWETEILQKPIPDTSL